MRARWLPARWLAVGGAVGLLAGCGVTQASPAQQQAQAAFVNGVHAADPQIGLRRTDVALVRLGHAACDGFRSGASYQVIADRLTVNEGRNPLPSEDLGAVITYAVTDFCPQYRDRLT